MGEQLLSLLRPPPTVSSLHRPAYSMNGRYSDSAIKQRVRVEAHLTNFHAARAWSSRVGQYEYK